MPRRYKDIFPSKPLLDSDSAAHISAAALMSVRYFRAEPDRMPEDVFAAHHILLNLQPRPHRVQNLRNGVLHDFTFQLHEIVVTPAGTRSGWRWFDRSDVIVVTLDPPKVGRFAEAELGMFLEPTQFHDLPLFHDPDLCAAGVLLRDALESDDVPSPVMFEAMSRVFLVKLLQIYGDQRPEEIDAANGLRATQFQKVLAHSKRRLDRSISVDELAAEAGMSRSQFNRAFKATLGTTPMQYAMAYRIEQTTKQLAGPQASLGDIALSCGFADQAHFSRSFKQATGKSPRDYRAAS